MKRRRFLQLTAGGLALAGSGAGFWWWSTRSGRERLAGEWLQRLARDMSGVAVIGRAWLEAYPDADPEAGLLASLGVAPDQPLSSAALAEAVGQAVEAELDAGQTFVHHGWWLSETEARLAALHVVLLGERASEPVEPGFDNARSGRIVRLQGFAPERLRQGEALAHPGLPERVIWFETDSRQPPRLVVVLDGDRIRIAPRDNGFSIRLRQALIDRLQARPGEHEIWLYDPVAQRRQQLGVFLIEAGEASRVGFCAVDHWGPKQTSAGQVFNEQPDGSAALWVQLGCFPPEAVLLFDEVELPTTLHPENGLITARVPDPTLYRAPGAYKVELLDRASGARQPVGEFRVTE